MTILDAAIERVMMYRTGATVRRRARILPVEGRWPATVEIAGLPLALEDESVRVTLPGDPAGLEIAAVRVGLTVRPRAEAPEAPSVVEIRSLERDIERIELESRLLSGEVAALLAVPVAGARPPAFEDRPPPASPTAGRLALEELLDERVRTRRARIRAIEEELRPLRERLADARYRHDQANAGRTARPDEITRVVRVQLAGEGTPPAEGVELELAYFVAGARWAPAYQVWIDGENARIALRALVTQASGEDWRGARLCLSTAAPGAWHELPELRSIRIGRAQPDGPPRATRPPPVGADALLADFDRDRRRLPTPPRAAALPGNLPVRPLALQAEVVDLPVGATFAADEAVAFERSAPMGPPPPAAPMRAAAFAGGVAQKRQAPAPAATEAAPAPPAEIRLPYSALRLRDPASDPARGHLSPVDRRTEWLAMLREVVAEVPFDAISLVERAIAESRAAAHRALPPAASDVGAASGRFDYVYDTDDPVEVPSDGGWHTIPIGDRAASVRIHYVVVPREDPSAWRMASLENPLRSPLVPGPVEVYVDGDYVLTSTIPAVAARERFQLGLGVEQAIRVSRNTSFSERRSGAAVVATTELWHQIEVTLLSQLPRPVTCQVRERIPIASKDAEVVIEEGEVSPDWFPYYQEEHGSVIRGGRRWEVQLPPGRPVKLEANYVVKLYVNNQVVGGNRREA